MASHHFVELDEPILKIYTVFGLEIVFHKLTLTIRPHQKI